MKLFKLLLSFTFLSLISITFAMGLDSIPLYKLDASYVINPDNSVNETLNFTLGTFINRSINLTIEHNVSDIHVSNGSHIFNFTLEDLGDKNLLHIPLQEPLTKLYVNYISYNNVFTKDEVNLFFRQFDFRDMVQKTNVFVALPQGSTIYKQEYAPSGGEIVTDGNKISIGWAETNLIGSITFSVKYVNPPPDKITQIIIQQAKSRFYFWQLFVLLLMAAIVVLYFYFKNRTKKDLLTGFRDDERKVLLYIQKNNIIWQNKIQHEFSFSRAKVTRIVKKLEEQQLIRKESYGRTNKLFWLK